MLQSTGVVLNFTARLPRDLWVGYVMIWYKCYVIVSHL